MFKMFFGKQSTTKADVIMALATAVIGVWKAVDTYRDYQADQLEKELES